MCSEFNSGVKRSWNSLFTLSIDPEINSRSINVDELTPGTTKLFGKFLSMSI